MRTVLLHNRALGQWVKAYLQRRGELAGAWDVDHAPTYDEIAALEPECVLSVKWNRILGPDWLGLAPWMLNMHNGFLPWNKGANPNVWPLVDGSPAGVTLHVMTEQLDGGPVIAQWELPSHALPYQTAESLYLELDLVAMILMQTYWGLFVDGEIGPVPQTEGDSSYHRVADLKSIDPTVRERLGVYIEAE